jgi:hypothetical protein
MPALAVDSPISDHSDVDSAHEPITEASWREQGRALAERRNGLTAGGSWQMWDIGDWTIAGEEQVFMTIKRVSIRKLAAEITGYSRHTINMAVSVARKLPSSTRIEGLAWGHHLLVAKLDPEQRSLWLNRAVRSNWSVATLRRQMCQVGVLTPRARNGTAREAITLLVEMSRSDISAELMEMLASWWRREIDPASRSGSERLVGTEHLTEHLAGTERLVGRIDQAAWSHTVAQ